MARGRTLPQCLHHPEGRLDHPRALPLRTRTMSTNRDALTESATPNTGIPLGTRSCQHTRNRKVN
eukprot:1190947-Prorocentrum_minimum.AAC.1